MAERQNTLEQNPGNMEIGFCKKEKKPRKTRKEIKFRSYVFTWFNATEQEIKKFQDYCEEHNYKYIMGDEICPTTGRQHWQGYVEGKNPWCKSTLDRLINGSWCESASGSSKSNWKYTTKDGKYLTNFDPERLKGSGREEILEYLESQIKRNKYFLDKNLNNARNNGEQMDAMEYAKYMNMKEKWTILSGNKTDMLKQLTKIYRAMDGNLKGILILGSCDDILLNNLYMGIVHDINGKLIIWGNRIEIRNIRFDPEISP